MATVVDKSYGFAGFTLDLRRGCLRRADREIALRPKSFDVLRYFVENAGRLLPRDELMSAIWRDVVVTDESLTHCVSDIRSALDDHDQRIIKTVLRRGYAFLPPVTEVAATGSNGLGADSNPGHLERRHPERRQLTILFCDLVGSTGLSARLDPEDLHELMGAYHRACAEEITKMGGFAAQHWGDAVVAYFGYPQAQEDDAERAIRAALGLLDTIRALARERGSALQIRVGIDTGLVVVGDAVGPGDARVAGQTPIVASRLQGLADPDRIVISDSTCRLAGGLFDYRDLGRITLRGRAEPVHAWEVVGASALQSRFEAKHGTRLTPLVNREEEMALLMQRWRQAQSGAGRVVLIAGEAGIGKSRLAVELRRRLRPDPHATLHYFCSPHHVDSPFHPVAAQIEHAARIARLDSALAKRDKLAALLDAATGATDLLLLAELVSIPAGKSNAFSGWSPQRKRKQTLDALLRQIERVSRGRAVLAIFEDVQWIDPSSQELLNMMIERVAALPVLLVITHRTEFEPPWIGAAHASAIMLGRLGQRDSEVLAALVAGGRLPEEVFTEIATRSDGIPINVEELTKAVLEAKSADAAEKGAAASSTPAVLAVPATLQASLIARLDRLGHPVNDVAETAAVIGREFSYELLAAVAQKSDEELQSALTLLGEAGLVSCRGQPLQATYLFKHALMRNAAYDRLLRRQRQMLHARIAATLEERLPEIVEHKPELLALHWTEAGSLDRAIGYWAKATQRARSRHALVEAIALADKGLALLPMLDETTERRRAELRLQSELGWALFHWKDQEAAEVGAAFGRARVLCRELAEKSALGHILYAEASHHLARGDYTLCRQMAGELLDLARERDDVGFASAAYEILGRSFHLTGEYASAVANFAPVISDPGPSARDQFSLGPNARANCLLHLAIDLMRLGYPDQAVTRRDQALALARNGHPYTVANAFYFARMLDLERGMRDSAGEWLAELSAVATKQSFTVFAAHAELQRAAELSAQGDTEEGLASARRACENVALINKTTGAPGRLLVLAECCERAGEIGEALRLLDAALAKAEKTGEHLLDAELHRLKGGWLIAHRPQRRAEAEDCYCRAMAIAREQQVKLYELRAAAGLARLWRDEGRSRDGRDLLAPVYGWFTEGLDIADLCAAKALLDQLQAMDRSGTGSTAREAAATARAPLSSGRETE